jgi:prepilin-type N-terminal cleavage/methylation domain-containing protein
MTTKKQQNGFTLIEILMAAVISVILAGGILTLQYLIGKNQLTVWNSYLDISQANQSVSALVAELRTARNGENGAYPLEKADANEIIFYSDTDFDGVVEKMRYFLSGTSFSRGITEPTGFPTTYISANEKVKELSAIVRNDTTPVFYYHNNDWPIDTINNPLTTPASPANVKLIKINLRLNTEAGKPNSDYVLTNFTQIRMLKSNL